MHTRVKTAVIALTVGALLGLTPMYSSPAAACPGGRNCDDVNTDPRPDGWAGTVADQYREVNRGSGGGAPPQPCDPRLWEHGRVGEYPDDLDPDDLEGYVAWRYDEDRNDYNQGRDEPTEGTYFKRVCVIGDEELDYYIPGTRCAEQFVHNLCNAECPYLEDDAFCRFGSATQLFDAIDPEQLTEFAITQEFEELINVPEPHLNPDDTTVVNIDTHLWVTGTDTADSLVTSISVPGITLTINAHRDDFLWDMGDGEIVACPDAGIDPGADTGNGSCTYNYPQSSAGVGSNDRYEGSVSIQWVGVYSGSVGGAAIDEQEHVVIRQNEFDIAVAEGQAIVVD